MPIGSAKLLRGQTMSQIAHRGSVPGNGAGPGVDLLSDGRCRSFTGRSMRPGRDRCTVRAAFPPARGGGNRPRVILLRHRRPTGRMRASRFGKIPTRFARRISLFTRSGGSVPCSFARVRSSKAMQARTACPASSISPAASRSRSRRLPATSRQRAWPGRGRSGEDCPRHGAHHRLAGPARAGRQGALEMHAAALPPGTLRAAASRPSWTPTTSCTPRRPRRATDRRTSARTVAAPDGRTAIPRISRRPSVSTATITAIETIRPPPRRFTQGASSPGNGRSPSSGRFRNACTRASICSQSHLALRHARRPPLGDCRQSPAGQCMARAGSSSGAGRDAVDIGFLYHRHQSLRGGATRLEEGRETAALAQLGDIQADAASAGIPLPWPAAPLGECQHSPVGQWLRWFSRSGLRLPCPAPHPAAIPISISRCAASRDQLAQEIRVIAPGDQARKVDQLPVIVLSTWSSASTTSDYEEARWPPARPRAALRQGLRARPPAPPHGALPRTHRTGTRLLVQTRQAARFDRGEAFLSSNWLGLR